MDKRFLEEDLSKPVQDFFIKQGYTVRSEVKYCDITAIKGEELIVIELKKNLSIELLLQTVKRQKVANLVYAAVPKPKNMIFTSKWKDICHLFRRLELGLLLVSFKDDKSFVEVAVEPKAFDRYKSIKSNEKNRGKIVKEIEGRYCDLNKGGSKGKKLVTSYRENSIFIACCINKLGPLSPKALKELGTDAKKTGTILSMNHYDWFIKLSRGIYSLTDKGRQALEIYSELTKYYEEKISIKKPL